jgi:methylmalonyl-CoA epimerase
MLTNLINVALAVNDIEASAERLQKAFGFTLDGEIVTQPGLQIRTAMLKAGNSTIELISPMPGETILRKFIDSRGEGVYRVAFGADDWDSTLAHLRENDVSFVDVSTAAGRGPGERIVFTHPKAAHGLMLELVEGR